MKKKIALITLALAVVFAGVQVASAAGFLPWGNSGGPPLLSSGNWQSPLAALGLSDQQSSQLQTLQKSMYDKTKDIRTQLLDDMFSLRQLELQKNVDQSAVNSKINEINNLRTQMYNNGQQARQQLQSILTPDQLDKLGSGIGPAFRGGGRGPGIGGFGPPFATQQTAPSATPSST